MYYAISNYINLFLSNFKLEIHSILMEIPKIYNEYE